MIISLFKAVDICGVLRLRVAACDARESEQTGYKPYHADSRIKAQTHNAQTETGVRRSPGLIAGFSLLKPICVQ